MGSFDTLFAAIAAFVAGHWLLASVPVREPLVKWVGRQRFLVAYSAAMLAALLWVVHAYQAAPRVPLWSPPPVMGWATVVLMPPACLLVVAGMTTPGTTAVGGERFAQGPHDPAPGIHRITRHPVLMGVTLWALGHLTTVGDVGSVLLFGGMAALAVGGAVHIDLRRARALGPAWGPIRLTTSIVPFHAIVTRRTQMDWRGIGLWRPAVALLLYAGLAGAHLGYGGVAPWPG